MSKTSDLIGVAVNGLFARKVRTLLLLLGPVIGVAAIVAAVGLTDSAKGDLKRKVDELGTNLIEAVRQLFGEGGPRQVANTRNALVTGIGGIPYARNWNSSVVMILTPNG